MADNMPKKADKPAGCTDKKSCKGPHGGGTPYMQAKIGNDFIAVDPRAGHTQKTNTKP